jgi:hypothetical protein
LGGNSFNLLKDGMSILTNAMQGDWQQLFLALHISCVSGKGEGMK